MTDNKKNSFFTLINSTMLLIGLYNIIFWVSRVKYAIPEFYIEIAKHWKLIMFLEFLAVASIAVDTIVRFDIIDAKYRKIRFSLAALIGLLFMAKLILGIIELYMRGEIKP
jgi:hypothetical protein